MRLARYSIVILMFGAFCLWGAFENGLPKDSDMWILAGAGTFFVAVGIWIVYWQLKEREVERPRWERDDDSDGH